MATVRRISPCLWFDHQAEEAAAFYVSIFPESKMGPVTYYGHAGAQASGRPQGSVMTVAFQICGQEFLALNGGPVFTFTEAVSFMVQCETQPQIDEMWARLSEGGSPGPCGWLKDKYGLSWQIVVPACDEMLRDPDRQRAERVMQAILGLTKPDVEAIQGAYDGREPKG